MAVAGDVVLNVVADTTEFEISICKSRYQLAKAEMNFWEGKLAAALQKRG
jgi:hypothetical protein